ncbi:MAG: cytochrome c biogenesis protein ResB [Pirellulales bacterium]
MAFRYRRDYKPYTVTLKEVRKDDYLGSNIPRNYSSNVVVEDPRDDYRAEHLIRMNEPLRYKGETFYQSGYEPGGTTLQIVSNTGWMIPYVSCMIVLTGMVFQFMQTLGRFFNRLEVEGGLDRVPLLSGGLPLVFCAVALVGFCGYSGMRLLRVTALSRPVESGPDLIEFGKIPAVFKGRVKPLDTLARNSLLIISRSESFVVGEGKDAVKEPAIRWLLDLWGDFETFQDYEIFYLDHPELLSQIHLPRTKKHLYSWKQLTEPITLKPLIDIWKRTRGKAPDQRDALEKKAAELEIRMNICNELLESNRGVDFASLIRERTESPQDREAFLMDLSRAFVEMGQLTVQTPLLIPYDVDRAWGPELKRKPKKS